MSLSPNPITAAGARALHQAWQTHYQPCRDQPTLGPVELLLKSWAFQHEVVPDQSLQWWVATSPERSLQWVMGLPTPQGREWWCPFGEAVDVEAWCATQQASGHRLTSLSDAPSLHTWLRQEWSNHQAGSGSFTEACKRTQDGWSGLGGGLLFEKAPGTPPVDVDLLSELMWFHFSCHPYFGQRIMEDLNRTGVRATTVQAMVAKRADEVAALMEPFGIQVRRSWAFPLPMPQVPTDAPRPPSTLSDKGAEVSETLSRRRRRF